MSSTSAESRIATAFQMGSSLGWARGGVNRHGQRRFVDACAALGTKAAVRDGRLVARWR